MGDDDQDGTGRDIHRWDASKVYVIGLEQGLLKAEFGALGAPRTSNI